MAAEDLNPSKFGEMLCTRHECDGHCGSLVSRTLSLVGAAIEKMMQESGARFDELLQFLKQRMSDPKLGYKSILRGRELKLFCECLLATDLAEDCALRRGLNELNLNTLKLPENRVKVVKLIAEHLAAMRVKASGREQGAEEPSAEVPEDDDCERKQEAGGSYFAQSAFALLYVWRQCAAENHTLCDVFEALCLRLDVKRRGFRTLLADCLRKSDLRRAYKGHWQWLRQESVYVCDAAAFVRALAIVSELKRDAKDEVIQLLCNSLCATPKQDSVRAEFRQRFEETKRTAASGRPGLSQAMGELMTETETSHRETQRMAERMLVKLQWLELRKDFRKDPELEATLKNAIKELRAKVENLEKERRNAVAEMSSWLAAVELQLGERMPERDEVPEYYKQLQETGAERLPQTVALLKTKPHFKIMCEENCEPNADELLAVRWYTQMGAVCTGFRASHRQSDAMAVNSCLFRNFYRSLSAFVLKGNRSLLENGRLPAAEVPKWLFNGVPVDRFPGFPHKLYGITSFTKNAAVAAVFANEKTVIRVPTECCVTMPISQFSALEDAEEEWLCTAMSLRSGIEATDVHIGGLIVERIIAVETVNSLPLEYLLTEFMHASKTIEDLLVDGMSPKLMKHVKRKGKVIGFLARVFSKLTCGNCGRESALLVYIGDVFRELECAACRRHQFGVFCSERQPIKCLKCGQKSLRREFCVPRGIDKEKDTWLGAKCPKCDAPQWQARIEYLKSDAYAAIITQEIELSEKLVFDEYKFSLSWDAKAVHCFVHMACDSRMATQTVVQRNGGILLSTLMQFCANVYVANDKIRKPICKMADALANAMAEMFEGERRDAVRSYGPLDKMGPRTWRFVGASMHNLIVLHEMCHCESEEDVARTQRLADGMLKAMKGITSASDTDALDVAKVTVDFLRNGWSGFQEDDGSKEELGKCLGIAETVLREIIRTDGTRPSALRIVEAILEGACKGRVEPFEEAAHGRDAMPALESVLRRVGQAVDSEEESGSGAMRIIGGGILDGVAAARQSEAQSFEDAAAVGVIRGVGSLLQRLADD